MRTIRLTIDLTYDPENMHGDEAEAMAWFRDDILGGEYLRLEDCGDLGDVIGSVTVIGGREVIAPPQTEGDAP